MEKVPQVLTGDKAEKSETKSLQLLMRANSQQ
jgi:hypothetical protein